MLGCGNSGLGDDMYDDGFERIVNIDVRDGFGSEVGISWDLMMCISGICLQMNVSVLSRCDRNNEETTSGKVNGMCVSSAPRSLLSRLSVPLPYILGLEMDIRNLSFEDESFDVLIDKGAFSTSIHVR